MNKLLTQFKQRGVFLIILVIWASFTLACSGSSGSVSGGGDEPLFPASCGEKLQLELVPLDTWGRPLDKKWSITLLTPLPEDRKKQWDYTSSKVLVDLVKGNYQITVQAPDHFDLSLSCKFTADLSLPDQVIICNSINPAETAIFSLAVLSADKTKDACPRLALFLGLDHHWFAATGPPHRLNHTVEFFLNGAPFWQKVDQILKQAKEQIGITTWWWQSNFELTRPGGHESMTSAQREKNTILHLLESKPEVKSKVLISQFFKETSGGVSYLNSDKAIRDHARDKNSNIEMMQQANITLVSMTEEYKKRPGSQDFAGRIKQNNPTYKDWLFFYPGKISFPLLDYEMASYHQKAMAIDGRHAFISGMNIKSTDWDTNDHQVFDSRRMIFKSSNAERAKVKAKQQLPDLGPRKDYGVYFEGPGANDVDAVLQTRWELGRKTEAVYAEFASSYNLIPYSGPTGTIPAQVVVTMPEPLAQVSILETMGKAIDQAKSYIYIEDQYFRTPLLDQRIVNAMQRNPGLHLIVVTKPVALEDGGKKYTYQAHKLFQEKVPDRYLMLQLKTFEYLGPIPENSNGAEASSEPLKPVYFVNIDVHSKLRIIDDTYILVGSCNFNNRGFLYEGEMNLAILDKKLASQARERVFANLVGPQHAAKLTGNTVSDFKLLKDLSLENSVVEEFWQNVDTMTPEEIKDNQHKRPSGFVYPLSFTSDYLLDVGPDAF